ncbi:MAG: NHL repeat-containing protein [Calditrichaeota bacterium]|nr:NHL repeat-containing protein [Calditrichota bacterium]
MNRSTCRWITSLLLLLAVQLSASGLREIRITQSWSASMSYPTDLALDSQGRAWVVDGLNRRLLVFSAGLETPREIALPTVGKALGIDIADDRVWLTDTAGPRLLVLDLEGHLQREITLPPDCDPVDVLATPRGVVIADNDNQRLLMLDGQDRLVRTIGNGGGKAESLVPISEAHPPECRTGNRPAEFSFPGILARIEKDFMVVDVLGGRIQVFQPDGSLSHIYGMFGADGESLFRPKGVCGCRVDGGVWITDSYTGLIHGYDDYGKRQESLALDGAPWRLEGPTAISCCGEGIWVVDCRAGKLYRSVLK